MFGSSESSFKAIETRPEHLDAWLNDLPYLNFERCVTLLEGALRQTNALKLKPQTRLELLESYVRPYRYLLDTDVRGAAAKGNKRPEAVMQNVQSLKRVANELAIGCKAVLDDPAYRKSRRIQGKLTARASFLAAKRQIHILLLSFHDYSPTPRNIWLDLFKLIEQAEAAGHLHETVDDTEIDPPTESNLGHEFRRILLASLVDPHHEPYGTFWKIYDLADRLADAVKLAPVQPQGAADGCFVVDLGSDDRPLAPARFADRAPSGQLRLLDVRPALHELAAMVKKLDARQGAEQRAEQRFLKHLWQSWSTPAQRGPARKPRKGAVELARGLRASFYHLNGGSDVELGLDSATDGIWVEGEATTRTVSYPLQDWSVSNTSKGGVAVYSTHASTGFVPVGEIVAIRVRGDTGAFRVGIVRWLVLQQQAACKIGVQWLPAVRPATVDGGPSSPHNQRPGLYSPASEGPATLITTPGVYREQSELRVAFEGREKLVTMGRLIESTDRFERFEISAA